MILYSCGCSFTYGSGPSDSSVMLGQVKNYSDYLSDLLDLQVTNLSFPGCSNYGIAVQIRHAIEQNPDFIIFNTTTSMRYEFVKLGKEVSGTPTIDDLSSINNINSNIFCGHYSIIETMLKHNKNILRSKWNWARYTPQQYQEIYDFLTKYTSLNVKIDQDTLMIKGIIQELKESEIPFVCIDTVGIVNDPDVNKINLPWEEYVELYPFEKDKYHWNEQGHEMLAKRLAEYL